MERKLASVQRIEKLESIANADSLEKAKVLGWEVVVKKGEFKEGDLCIYVECDSVLPGKPMFEFMKQRKFRVRTIKLRGQISQGICFPISPCVSKYSIGDDVTKTMEIVKWVSPGERDDIAREEYAKRFKKPWYVNLFWKVVGLFGWKQTKELRRFPHYVPKTDETRLQTIPRILEELKGVEVYETIKMDGCSATYIWKDGKFIVCSRNLVVRPKDICKDTQKYWDVAVKYELEEKLKKFGRNIAIQGEVMGLGIQENRYKIPEVKFFVYNIYDIDKKRYLDYEEMLKVLEELMLLGVPQIRRYIMSESTVNEFVERAKVSWELGTKAEGIVVRPTKEMFSYANGGRASFKVLNTEYLLFHNL